MHTISLSFLMCFSHSHTSTIVSTVNTHLYSWSPLLQVLIQLLHYKTKTKTTYFHCWSSPVLLNWRPAVQWSFSHNGECSLVSISHTSRPLSLSLFVWIALSRTEMVSLGQSRFFVSWFSLHCWNFFFKISLYNCHLINRSQLARATEAMFATY